MVIPKKNRCHIDCLVGLAAGVCFLLAAGCSGQETARGKAVGVLPPDNAVVQETVSDNAAIDNGAVSKGLFTINGAPVGAVELREFIFVNDPDAAKNGGAEVAGLTDQLINNRLLAAKALEAGLEKNDMVRSKLESKLNQLWHDAYWNFAVRSTINISEKQILAKRPVFEELISIQQLVVPSKEKADALRAKAVSGADFDKIVEDNSEGLTVKNKGKIGYIKKGSAMYEPDLTNQLFKLKTGEFSPVVSTPIGYSVIRLVDRKTIEQSRKEWLADNREKIKRELETEIWKKRLDKLVASHKVVVNKKNIAAYMAIRQKKGDVNPMMIKPAFSIDKVNFMMADLIDPSGMGVVHGEETLEIIINKRAEEFAIAKEVERLKIKEKVPDIALKERIARESILARGYINYRCRDIRVTPAEIRKYYDDNPTLFVAPPALALSFIETKSKARLDQIYAELKSGKPFAEVADKWSDNKKLAGGKSSPVPESQITPEFAAVKSLKVGEYLKSPITLKSPKGNLELFVIARLDEVFEKSRIPFDKANKATIEKSLQATKRAEIVKGIMADLRKGNKVVFNPEYDKFRKTFVKMTSTQRGAK